MVKVGWKMANGQLLCLPDPQGLLYTTVTSTSINEANQEVKAELTEWKVSIP